MVDFLGGNEQFKQGKDIGWAVVEGSGSEEDDDLVSADIPEILVILGILVAEAMDFIDDDHFDVVIIGDILLDIFQLADGVGIPIVEPKLLEIHAPAAGFVFIAS